MVALNVVDFVVEVVVCNDGISVTISVSIFSSSSTFSSKFVFDSSLMLSSVIAVSTNKQQT